LLAASPYMMLIASPRWCGIRATTSSSVRVELSNFNDADLIWSVSYWYDRFSIVLALIHVYLPRVITSMILNVDVSINLRLHVYYRPIASSRSSQIRSPLGESRFFVFPFPLFKRSKHSDIKTSWLSLRKVYSSSTSSINNDPNLWTDRQRLVMDSLETRKPSIAARHSRDSVTRRVTTSTGWQCTHCDVVHAMVS